MAGGYQRCSRAVIAEKAATTGDTTCLAPLLRKREGLMLRERDAFIDIVSR